jgi:hypothetical protein
VISVPYPYLIDMTFPVNQGPRCTEDRKSRSLSLQECNLVGLRYFKGTVSRDWGRLQMVFLDRSEVSNDPAGRLVLIRNSFYNWIFFKMVSVRVHFRPGFPLGGGFPAEQFAPEWWK